MECRTSTRYLLPLLLGCLLLCSCGPLHPTTDPLDLVDVGHIYDGPIFEPDPWDPGVFQPPVAVRLVVDSFWCIDESDVDMGTSDDEPYMMLTGIATHATPVAWATGFPKVFSNVDRGENRRLQSSQRLIQETLLPADTQIGFNITMMENDGWTESSTAASWRISSFQHNIQSHVNDVLQQARETDLDGFNNQFPTLAATTFSEKIDYLYSAIQGGYDKDDFIAEQTLTYSFDELRDWAAQKPYKTHYLELDGGDEGRYRLRFHLAFGSNPEKAFAVRKFTHYDALAVGNMLDGETDEIMLVIDDDAPGDDGRFEFYTNQGQLVWSFDAFYTRYDRVAVGDVLGNNYDEILVASDDNGGQVAIYSAHDGHQLRNFAAPFSKYDGFAIGDVTGDSKLEILIARDDDKRVHILNAEGQILNTFGLGWDFDGTRYLANVSSARHDAFLVGDVLGNAKDEIVMLDNQNGFSTCRVYDLQGTELRRHHRIFFTHHDAALLADVTGDTKKELLIGVDGADGWTGLTLWGFSVDTGAQADIRYWPWFTKYDGFAAGRLFSNTAKEQLIMATDEDDIIAIAK
jgi:hypothetical protein